MAKNSNSHPKHAGLTPDKLRWHCDPANIPFESTAQVEPAATDMGQERALRALRMGVELTASGYNLFVCGLSGTSRGGMIVRMIEEMHPQDRARAGPLLREQFQEHRPAAAADAATRPGERIQEGSRIRDRFFAPAHSAGVRRRAFPATEDAHRGALHRARKGIDGRFHAADRARAVRAGPHAGGRRGAAGDFSGARGPDGAHRGNPEDGAGREARERGRGGTRAEIRPVPARIHDRLPAHAFAFAGAGERDELPRAGSGVGAGRRRDRGAQGKILRPADFRISRGSAPPHPRQSRPVQGTRGRRGAAAFGEAGHARGRSARTAILSACTAST